MKLYKSLFAAVAVATCAGMVSCDDDLDRPPVIIPVATYEVNTAIADFKEAYWQYASGDSYGLIPVNAQGDSIIIGGHIVSTDAGGNMYKQIVVQDQSGAILIGVNASGLDEGRYKYGEEVRINLTGLYVGNYRNLIQIGMPYEGKIGRIDEDLMKLHTQCNGLPDPSAVDALILNTDIPAIVDLNKASAEVLRKYQSVIVRFDKVHFQGGGELFWSDNPGGKNYTQRLLMNETGKGITVNTSNQCNFAGDLLPAGDGSVTAILSYFDSDWQLVICDPATDCTGFQDIPADNIVFSAMLSSSMDGFSIQNVTEVPTSLGAVWKLDSQYSCMVAKGYDGTTNYATDSWFITPVIDLGGMETGYATFRHAQNYFGSAELAKSECTFAIREAGTETWTQLTINYPEYNGKFNFISSGDIDLAEWLGKKVEFGFHYKSTTSKAGTWELNNFMVKRKCIGAPDIPVKPDDPVVETIRFRKATAVTSGKSYILVTDGKIALPLSGNYGYLQTSDVTVSGDEVSTDGANAFVIESTTGGYTIKDSKNRYLYMTGTYNSFNTSDTAVEGSAWTVTSGADGTMTITNALKSKTIQYDSKYNSYGAYADVSHPLPTLYERID